MTEIAKARGATVLAGATSKAKGALAMRHGADHWIDLSVVDPQQDVRAQVEGITGEGLCDAVLDVVGGKIFDATMRCVGYRGRMVIVGFATMDISMPKGHHILLKNISIIGAPLDIHFRKEPEIMDAAVADLFGMYARGAIRPEIMPPYSFDEFGTALGLFGTGGIAGRVVLTTGRS